MSKCKALNESAAFGYDIGEECGDDAVAVIHNVPVCFTHREKYLRIKTDYTKLEAGEFISTSAAE